MLLFEIASESRKAILPTERFQMFSPAYKDERKVHKELYSQELNELDYEETDEKEQSSGKIITKLDMEKVSSLTQSQSKGCSCANKIRLAAVAFAVFSLVVGTIGLLVLVGQLQIGLRAVGMMSNSTALYTMLTGYGFGLIITSLLLTSLVTKPKPKNDQLEEL